MTFTDDQIKDAIQNPRPGDLWERGMWCREVVRFDWVGGIVVHQGAWKQEHSCSLQVWKGWTRNATLVRRGA